MKHNVILNGKEISVDSGKLLSDVIIDEGYNFPMPCAGQGVCGKCKVIKDGVEVLACRTVVDSDMNVSFTERGSVISGDNAVKSYGEYTGGLVDICIDIGTTTIALAVIDRGNNEELMRKAFDNPDRKYGIDVMSRIDYSMKNGTDELSNTLIEGLNRELQKIAHRYKGISHIYVSGNTVMLHIFMRHDISSMGMYPYETKFLISQRISAKELGIRVGKEVITLPCISAFVGSDVVAGLISIGEQGDKYNLLIDMGTNAETVLFRKGKYLTASAAAGPCFEGGNISCGMSASDGAITHFVYPDDIEHIGDNKPVGICGTALIDIIAELLRHGIIDNSGHIDGRYFVADGVMLTQEDIRQFQLAKAAVRTATELLVKRAGISINDIAKVYIAGGFSWSINLNNLVHSGIIARELQGKCVCIGNSSLDGCVAYRNNSAFADKIISNAEVIDIAMEEEFGELFVSNIDFDKKYNIE